MTSVIIRQTLDSLEAAEIWSLRLGLRLQRAGGGADENSGSSDRLIIRF